MARTPNQIVAAEVHYCVSSLVSTLCRGTASCALGDLTEQAFELASPIDDWEEAALHAGWTMTGQSFHHAEHGFFHVDNWQTLCVEHEIEPYQREVFEHWIVSDWLAEQLAAKGEKVDTDFAGMTVWARTTSGRGIASDSVIEAIAADMAKRYGA